MQRAVVLATCNITEPLTPKGGRPWTQVLEDKLKEQGSDIEVKARSMTPGKYANLAPDPLMKQPFDYLIMEITGAWLTMRTLTARVQRSTPAPVRRRFVSGVRSVTDWAGGPQKVWASRDPGFKGKVLHFVRDATKKVVKPRPIAAPEDFELFIRNGCELAAKYDAKVIIFYAGVRSSRPAHKWARDLLDELDVTIRRIQPELGFAVVDIFPYLSARHPHPELFHDGLHPNLEGHIRFGSEMTGAINEVGKGNTTFYRQLTEMTFGVDKDEIWSLPEREPAVATA
jgi:hypothetical protein